MYLLLLFFWTNKEGQIDRLEHLVVLEILNSFFGGNIQIEYPLPKEYHIVSFVLSGLRIPKYFGFAKI